MELGAQSLELKEGGNAVIEKDVDGVIYYEFPLFAGIPGLRHGIFTRKGGHSRGAYASLNVGASVGDSPEAVQKNRHAVARVMAGARLIFLSQVHGRDVIICNTADAAPGLAPEGDAVITNACDVSLVIQAADCQSVLLYDPAHRVVGNIHSGWRGSIQNIIGRTVEKMTQVFGTRPQDLLAGIGPSLGPCCAEFTHYHTEIPEALWRYKHNECHFDFWAMSCDQLSNAGVNRENIQIGALCTRCRTDLFFSYRAEKTTGRFAAVIGLTEQTKPNGNSL